MTRNSIATPTTTKKVNTHTECSQNTDELSRILMSLSRADMALSSAEMELSKAEASVGKFEALWIKWAKITIVLLLASMVYGVSLIILALPSVDSRTIRRAFWLLSMGLHLWAANACTISASASRHERLLDLN
jgi:hypothetical protein